MNKESMSIRNAAAMVSISTDAALIFKKFKLPVPDVKIKKHPNPDMRAMYVLEFVADLLRKLSGRKDEKPKPQKDQYGGIIEGMNVRDTNSGEYGKCFARYSVGSAKGSVFMVKFSLIVDGHKVERKVECANCEIMTDDMIKKAEKLALDAKHKAEEEQAAQDKKAEKLTKENEKQLKADERARP